MIQKYKKGEVVFESPWFKNTILENGLNMLYDTRLYHSSLDACANWCNVGTDNTPPAVSQSGLYNHVTSTVLEEVTTEEEVLPSPHRGRITVLRYVFSEGTFNGENLTEVGLSESNNSNYLNRQLIKTLTFEEDELIDTGDGTVVEFSGVLDKEQCHPQSLTIYAYDTSDNVMSLTDNDLGELEGDGTGTINYSTGEVDVTFNSSVKDGSGVYANYRWYEPTVVNVASDEMLVVNAQFLQYAELQFGETKVEGFTFEDLTEGTSDSFNVTKKLVGFSGWYDLIAHPSLLTLIATGLDTQLESGDSYESPDKSERCDSTNRTFTTYAAGGPKVKVVGTWAPGTIDFDIKYIYLCRTVSPRARPRPVMYEFELENAITDIDVTEEIVFEAEFSWGEI